MDRRAARTTARVVSERSIEWPAGAVIREIASLKILELRPAYSGLLGSTGGYER